MMAYKTPGVYIVEKNAFPNSVVAASTGIPLFIGHTARAETAAGDTLEEIPTRITSMTEFEALFGGAPGLQVEFDNNTYKINGSRYYLYRAVQLFFANEGSVCWIVSVGNYDTAVTTDTLDKPFEQNSEAEKAGEPDLIVIPDAVALESEEDSASIYGRALLANDRIPDKRFVLMDLRDGASSFAPEIADTFRTAVSTGDLAFGAAYYPWIHTNLISVPSLAYCTSTTIDHLKALIQADTPEMSEEIATAIDEALESGDAVSLARAHSMAAAQSPRYVIAMQKILEVLNLQPTGGAIAGVYANTDKTAGVFKAPANLGMAAVVAPAAQISNQQQEGLNAPASGKAINAIRTFPGGGTLIWGARTLDANSLDWRYVPVRRMVSFLEKSIRAACQAYVFEPNTAQTWVSVKAMIENFLYTQWKDRGLAGAVPEDAYSVHVGLGSTMTAQDILDGQMNVSILIAVARPAEFIELTFTQKMQAS